MPGAGVSSLWTGENRPSGGAVSREGLGSHVCLATKLRLHPASRPPPRGLDPAERGLDGHSPEQTLGRKWTQFCPPHFWALPSALIRAPCSPQGRPGLRAIPSQRLSPRVTPATSPGCQGPAGTWHLPGKRPILSAWSAPRALGWAGHHQGTRETLVLPPVAYGEHRTPWRGGP